MHGVSRRTSSPPEACVLDFFALKRRRDDGFSCGFLFALFHSSIDPPFLIFTLLVLWR